MNLVLNGKDLTIQDIKQFLEEDGQISISEEALVNVRKSRETVEKIIKIKKRFMVLRQVLDYLVMY